MNKKGQTFTYAIILIIIGLIWITGGAVILNDIGLAAISSGSLSGFEAFFYGNLNFLFGAVYGVAWFVYLR